MAIRGKIKGGSGSPYATGTYVSPYKTGTYVGTQGNKHFFTAEGTGGDSSDSVTFDDPSKNQLDWGTRFQKGKQYRYQMGNPNLPIE